MTCSRVSSQRGLSSQWAGAGCLGRPTVYRCDNAHCQKGRGADVARTHMARVGGWRHATGVGLCACAANVHCSPAIPTLSRDGSGRTSERRRRPNGAPRLRTRRSSCLQRLQRSSPVPFPSSARRAQSYLPLLLPTPLSLAPPPSPLPNQPASSASSSSSCLASSSPACPCLTPCTLIHTPIYNTCSTTVQYTTYHPQRHNARLHHRRSLPPRPPRLAQPVPRHPAHRRHREHHPGLRYSPSADVPAP